MYLSTYTRCNCTYAYSVVYCMVNIHISHTVSFSVMYLLLLFIIINVVVITQLMNVTVCLTQSTTASFTCVVDRGGIPITSAQWQIHVGGGVYISVTGIARHMVNSALNGDMLTDTLIVTNVSVNDNGALYRCQPSNNAISDVATLTVLGMYVCTV